MQVTRNEGRGFAARGTAAVSSRRMRIGVLLALLVVAALAWCTQTAAAPAPIQPPAPVTAGSEAVAHPQTAPISLDPYADFEQERWEERRLDELVAEERARIENENAAALAAARGVDLFEAAFIERLMYETFIIDRAKLRTRVAFYHLDPYQAYEDEVWRDQVARVENATRASVTDPLYATFGYRPEDDPSLFVSD